MKVFFNPLQTKNSLALSAINQNGVQAVSGCRRSVKKTHNPTTSRSRDQSQRRPEGQWTNKGFYMCMPREDPNQIESLSQAARVRRSMATEVSKIRTRSTSRRQLQESKEVSSTWDLSLPFRSSSSQSLLCRMAHVFRRSGNKSYLKMASKTVQKSRTITFFSLFYVVTENSTPDYIALFPSSLQASRGFER